MSRLFWPTLNLKLRSAEMKFHVIFLTRLSLKADACVFTNFVGIPCMGGTPQCRKIKILTLDDIVEHLFCPDSLIRAAIRGHNITDLRSNSRTPGDKPEFTARAPHHESG